MYTEFTLKYTTINLESCRDIIKNLKTRIRSIRPTRIAFVLYRDNAKPHCSEKALKKKIDRPKMPGYTASALQSPNLVLDGYHIFLKSIESIRRTKFDSKV